MSFLRGRGRYLVDVTLFKEGVVTFLGGVAPFQEGVVTVFCGRGSFLKRRGQFFCAFLACLIRQSFMCSQVLRTLTTKVYYSATE